MRKTAHIKEPKAGMLVPPLVLAGLVVAIFIFPNVLADTLIKPAVASVYPGIAIDTITSVTHWHGLSTEVIMTLGIILFGSLCYWYRSHYQKVFILFPESFSFDRIYHSMLSLSDIVAKKVTNRYMTGMLNHYFYYIFSFFILIVGGLLLRGGAIQLTLEPDHAIGTFAFLIAGSIFVAGIGLMITKVRLTAILINGYIGFSIALFFVLFKAPDLALTQLVVETVTTTLFLLCFYFLPEWNIKPESKMSKGFRLVVAVGVGTVFTLIALSVKNGRLMPTISTFYENADELAGGNNIVNTILGDFRAFDTMLEVVVLFIAGIGVYTLIQFRKKKGADRIENK